MDFLFSWKFCEFARHPIPRLGGSKETQRNEGRKGVGGGYEGKNY